MMTLFILPCIYQAHALQHQSVFPASRKKDIHEGSPHKIQRRDFSTRRQLQYLSVRIRCGSIAIIMIVFFSRETVLLGVIRSERGGRGLQGIARSLLLAEIMAYR